MSKAKKLFIVIAGNIGAGKTSLTQALSEHFGWEPYYEPVDDNPYLQDFYSDMKRWAFPMQVYILSRRFEIHKQLHARGKSGIQDRSIYEDANIFARNLYEQHLMEPRDFKTYRILYEEMTRSIRPPDLILYLRKSLPRLKEQIALRGRNYEQSIPDDYLANLNRYYEEWMASYDLGKKLILDTDALDFVKNPNDFKLLVSKIEPLIR